MNAEEALPNPDLSHPRSASWIPAFQIPPVDILENDGN